MLDTAIILAAGLGTRMRPLTNDRPKPMVHIHHRPLIDYVIKMCLDAGVKKIIMNYHYKPQSLIDYIHNNYSDIVTLSDEQETLLDSGGGVLKALNYTDAQTFFVINADCIWHSEHNALNQLFTAYNDTHFDVFKLLCTPEKAIGFDGAPIYRLDNNNHISKISPLTHEFTGIQIIKRHLFDRLTIKPFSIREIWHDVFAQHKLGGIEFQGQWLHIGTPAGVQDAEDFLDIQD